MLDSLQQMTQAVSNNFSGKTLIDIYFYLLETHVQAKKMLLFFLGDAMPIIKSKGCSFQEVIPPLEILERDTIGTLNNPEFEGFDLVVPVHHKTKTIGVILVGRANPNNYLAGFELAFLQTISNILVYAYENKTLFRDKVNQEKVKQELKMAASIQEKLIPRSIPPIQNFTFSGFYKPFTEVGGDYFDVIKINPSEYLMIVADVSGKGLPAALLMSNIQAATRTLVRYESDLRKLTVALNHLVWEHAEGDHFVVAFMGLLNVDNHEMQYINAGQVAPLWMHQNQLYRLAAQTHPLGVLDPMRPYQINKITFEQGSTLFLFTDGLSDSVSQDVQTFDIRLGMLSGQAGSAKEWEAKLLDHLALGPHRDDLSLLTISFHELQIKQKE